MGLREGFLEEGMFEPALGQEAAATRQERGLGCQYQGHK